MAFRVPPHLLKAFVDQGLVPDDCRQLEIIVPGNGALLLRYEIFLRDAHLEKLAAAFAALATGVTRATAPPAADAVDPHVDSTGKPSQRDPVPVAVPVPPFDVSYP